MPAMVFGARGRKWVVDGFFGEEVLAVEGTMLIEENATHNKAGTAAMIHKPSTLNEKLRACAT